MAKQIRKKSRRQKYKSHRRHTKKMFGGDFTDANKTELAQLGFNNNDIALLEQHIPNMNLIRISLQQVNPQTGNPFTPQEIMQNFQDIVNDEPNDENDELNISNISGDSDNDLNESFNLDNSFSNDDSMNTTRESINGSINNGNDSFGTEGSSLNLSDLNTSNASNSSMNTTREEDSFGGKKERRKTMKKQKRRTTKKQKRRTTKKRKGIKQRGGTCYGNGVGANNYDPNFSIHNTNLLKLFPYKPTN
jgi:hypothetical protein